MELSSFQFSYHPRMFFILSQKRISLLINTPIPKFPLKCRLSRLRSSHVSAHFGGRSHRRNSLRIKLTENPLVSPPFELESPDQVFDVMKKDSVSSSDVPGMEESHAINKGCDVIVRDTATVQKPKSNVIGSGGFFGKLDDWVNTYKEDVEFWGIGTSPIFTIYQGLDGKVERVSINNDEIHRRLGKNLADMTEVNSKFSHAKFLAEEIESGRYVFPKNSSIAKFVVSSIKSSVFDEIRSITSQPGVFLMLSRVGVFLFSVFIVFWMARKLLGVGDGSGKISRLENEMLRRKMKARNKRDLLEKGNVVVIQDSMVSTKRPQIDKQEVMMSISKTEMVEEKSVLKNSFEYQQSLRSIELEAKIQEIRNMARHVRKIEAADSFKIDTVEDDQTQNEEFRRDINSVIQTGKFGVDMKDNLKDDEAKEKGCSTIQKLPVFVEYPESIVHGLSGESASVNNGEPSITSNVEAILGLDSPKPKQFSDAIDTNLSCLKSNNIRGKSRIIRSVKEAKEYLSRKRVEKRTKGQEPPSSSDLRMPLKKELGSNTKLKLNTSKIVSEPLILSDTSDIATPEYLIGDKRQIASTQEQSDFNAQIINPKVNVKRSLVAQKEDWTEKYLEELKPFFEKIQVGFKDNFALARENVNPELYVNTIIEDHIDEDDELEWMKDDGLRKIVYRVRENELAGRDAFFDMGAEEKITFFKGLEEKVEKVNKNMLKVHEWVHSNIENVDYGADGISLYDPVEKIIPRWKGAPIARDPEFISNYMEQRKVFAAGKNEISHHLKEFEQESFQKSQASQSSKENDNSKTKFHGKSSKISKTLIESSDGSIKTGKRSGKEYWQHTKKWSRGFLEVYNAESDPEIKTDLRNMGKELDRWITENEIKEAGDLMDGLQKKKKEYIGTRIHNLKREMANFGPQAVVNKYRDYAQDKEEDYLWWLDLPFVLCIELYMQENGDQRTGLYTLEMASELELNPKPLHVIAFEDPGDCKNLCYIIQAHLKMLGNGFAFAVPHPPKDTFRVAKENGAGVTVIRKGELDLNVDQPLEEVEEQITELGSKIYHDQIMRGRSLDLGSLMKGVFGVTNHLKTRKRLKDFLKKRAEHTRHSG